MKFTAACVQTNSVNDMRRNIDNALGLVEKASASGADFIALPENVAFMADNGDELLANTYLPEDHPAIKAFIESAGVLGKWLLIGGVAVKIPGEEKIANRSFLISNTGKIVTSYDKIHLYDVTVQGGESHTESKRYRGGNKAVIAQTPWGKLGMTICYDLRFPHLYRMLAQAGASFITVPSSFTQFTGQAHWHTLLRARAIENGCYIIAPAQTGSHPANRKTYGHSLMIDPWGEILADGGEDVGFITAEIDTDRIDQVREGLPSLNHDRDFTLYSG